jgi:hypothetical protein
MITKNIILFVVANLQMAFSSVIDNVFYFHNFKGFLVCVLVWRGGVWLSCNLGRWIDLLPMSPVEGCPNVFQIVVSLVPGLHQVCYTNSASKACLTVMPVMMTL